jgi:tetrahydromethanopterin S-methyltransferase subunit H
MESAMVVKVGKCSIGGAVGEYPTALLGTLFFSGQRLLADPEKGIFEESEASGQIRKCEKAAARNGVSLFLDIVAETPAAMKNYLEFVIRNTSLPFLIDGSSEEVRLAGIETVRKHSALDRAVYNSIGTDTGRDEIEVLASHTPAAIVISAVDPMDFGLESALSIVSRMKEALPRHVRKRLLVDIGFLDEASVKISARIAREVRKRTMLPVGGAPCNGLYMWKALRGGGEDVLMAALSATMGYVAAFGLDFLFVGPLRNVDFVAPAVGAADVYNRYALQSGDPDRALPEEHPMRTMFRPVSIEG